MCPCVCPRVTDVGVAVTNLRVVCKIITCVSAFTFTELEMAIIILLIFLEIAKNCCKAATAAGLDTLRCRLREGCHCGRLPLHKRRAGTQDDLPCWTRTRHDFSLMWHSVQRARQPLSRLAWVASRWQGTLCSSSFVSKVLGANWKRATCNNFHPVADKFAIVH